MTNLSPSQLRAARALLNWSRTDLAAKAEVSEQTLHRFENGTHDSSPQTRQRLVRTLENAGIAFTEGNGVKFKVNNIEVYEGPDRFDEFYDFIYEHLKEYGGDVCIGSSDARLYAKYRKNPELHRERMRRLARKGQVRFRILAVENDYRLPASTYAQYRWLPKDSFAPTSFYAFGECLALISFVHDPAPYVVLHKSGPFAEPIDALLKRHGKRPRFHPKRP
jgi:transcriptional regulator with XRE-family HTH domain